MSINKSDNVSEVKRYRLGNQDKEYELVTEYLGWLPKNEFTWEGVFPALTLSSETKDKEVTLMSPNEEAHEVTVIIDHQITKDAFPMSFYREDRSKDWHNFCIVSSKDKPSEKFIIPLH